MSPTRSLNRSKKKQVIPKHKKHLLTRIPLQKMKESRIRNGSSPVAKLRLRSDTWKSETIFWSAGRQKSRSTWRKQQLVEVFATAVTWTRSVASMRIWKASVLSTSDVNRPKPLVDLSNVASDDLLQNFITTLTMKTKGTTMMAGKIETFLVCKKRSLCLIRYLQQIEQASNDGWYGFPQAWSCRRYCSEW